MTTEQHLIFVYGTLRKGYWNHKFIENSTFLGKGYTVSDKFVMRAVSYPFVSDAVGNDIRNSTKIFGELYAVTDAVFKDLDRLEGYPRFYDRRQVEVEIRGNGTEVAWMYINNKPSGRIIASGNYEEFKSPGEI